MKRFDLSNLPLDFLDEFHNIETDEVKEALIGIVNLMYDDYTVEQVEEMFSTFGTASYEVYKLFRYCDKNADSEYRQTLDMIVEVFLFCSSQLSSYKVNDPFRLLPRRS